MKTQLTKEQSQHLIDLGVPKEKASMIEHTLLTDTDGNPIDDNYKKTFTWRFLNEKPYKPFKAAFSKTSYAEQDIFTLTDILEILPKEIDSEDGGLCLEIQMMNDVCSVSYEYISHGGCKEYFEAEELIDALYELCVWTIENGYLKF